MANEVLKGCVAGIAAITFTCSIILFADKFYSGIKNLISKSHAVSSVIKKDKKNSEKVKINVDKEKKKLSEIPQKTEKSNKVDEKKELNAENGGSK